MNKETCEKDVRAIVSSITGLSNDDLEGRDNFIDDLGIESVMAVSIVSQVEKQFGIDIPPERFGEIDSIDAIVNVVFDLSQRRSA